MAISVSRSPSTWNTLSTTVQEKWLNENDAQDIVTKSTPTIWWNWKNAKIEELPFQLVVRLMDSEANVGDAFEYDDPVDTRTTVGPRAGQTTVRNYSFPLTLTWQEELEHMSPQAKANWIEIKTKQILQYAAKRLNIDFYSGSVSNTKRIDGLEQIFYAARAQSSVYSGSTIVYSPDVWRLRQAANSYLGITRVAFTADEVGGTGWEPVSLDYRNDATNAIQVSPYAPHGPDQGLIGLDMAFKAASYGMTKPTVLFSTRGPCDRYHYAVQAKSIIYKTADAFTGGTMEYSAVSFNGVPWFVDEFAKTWNTSYASNPSITSTERIYGFNDEFQKLWIDPRWNGLVTDARTPIDQHVSTRHLLYRLQNVNQNPRTGFTCFDIKTAY